MVGMLIPKRIKNLARDFLHAKEIYRSQAGQDFWVLGEVFDQKRNGFYLDIGAHDGIRISNTYVLETRYGWEGICVEANPDSFSLLQKNRRARCVNACLDASEGTVSFSKNGVLGGIVSDDTDNRTSGDQAGEVVTMNTIPLEKLLDETGAPATIDYLSIDIEGAEERVLGDFPFERYTFNCMTIERPSARLRQVLERNGYVLIKEIPGLDCFYIHQSHIGQYQANVFAFYKKERLAIYREG